MFKVQDINQSWTLFLDRDGVLNHEKELDYILNPDEFKFYERVPEAMRMLADVFGIIIIVTNQKGIGKKLMNENDLELIHAKLEETVKNAGGRIDKIFFCPELDDLHPDRKPNAGMALQAKAMFPQIDFNKSVMVGNRLTDMRFGRNAGMHTVYLTTTHPEIEQPHPDIDLVYPSLFEFAQAL